MTELEYYESLGLAIECAKKSFEEFKELICEKNICALDVIASLKEDEEENKFNPHYSLRYIVDWLTIAMIYDYMNEQKKGGTDNAG